MRLKLMDEHGGPTMLFINTQKMTTSAKNWCEPTKMEGKKLKGEGRNRACEQWTTNQWGL